MARHHVLILGGHGKIAQLLTPLLLRRSWDVTSIIRNPDQVAAVEKLAPSSPSGKLTVLVRSLEDISSDAHASALLDAAGRPDYVVWSAGAGGKGGPERTFAIDRDAAGHVIRAAAAADGGFVRAFVMISYLGSRRGRAGWWSEEEWEKARGVNEGVLRNYYQAKVSADEVLYEEGRKKSKEREGGGGGGFVGIGLRPGTLTDEGSSGKVELGRTKRSTGKVSRESVARVADELLARVEGGKVRNCWLDLLDGEEEIGKAVDRVVEEGVDCAEGEAFFGKL